MTNDIMEDVDMFVTASNEVPIAYIKHNTGNRCWKIEVSAISGSDQ